MASDRRLPRKAKKRQRRLMAAILVRDPRAVAAWLSRGASVGLPDPSGTTPLYLAAVQGAAECVRLLLRAGADPNLESGNGEEGLPLCAAACWGHLEAVRALLGAGADPALREDHGTGMTAADWARRGGHHETLAVLAGR